MYCYIFVKILSIIFPQTVTILKFDQIKSVMNKLDTYKNELFVDVINYSAIKRKNIKLPDF